MRRHRRRVVPVLSVAVALAMALVGGGQAVAQTEQTAPTTSTTELPTTTAAPTTLAPPTTAPPAAVPTTPVPDPSTTPVPGPSATNTTVAPAAAVGDSGPASDAPRLSSAAVDAAIDSIQRSGASSTKALMEALAPMSQFGLSPTDAAIKWMGKFPMAGLATWTDSWGDPRSNPTPHPHQGNDIFAAFGTPVRAPSDGTVRFVDSGAGGKAAYVTEPDGTYYYMAHLEGFPPDLASGASVTQGQVVGFNGDSGNARGGAPHVHFQFHPGGGAPVDPKPTLDRWLAEAMAEVPALLASFAGPGETPIPQVLLATGELRRFDAAAPGSEAATLFVRLAEAAEDYHARERSVAALLPVTPRALEPLVRAPLG